VLFRSTDALAEEYVATLTRLSPISATEMGLPGDETALDDFSPAGLRAQAEAAQEVLTALEGVQPTDEVDRITQLAMRERLGLELRSEAHTSELQSRFELVCRLLLAKKKNQWSS